MHVHGEASDASVPAEASRPAEGFTHQALIYDSDEEFIGVALPFVVDGIASGEPCLVAVQERHVDHIRSALGGDPPGVKLLALEQWYETSARTRDKFDRWVGENNRDRRVRLIGESPWAVGHDAQVRDWARHESVQNVAFAGHPLTFICPYDAGALPAEVIAHARSTHPEIVSSTGVVESGKYEDPLDFCARLDADVRRQPGEAEVETAFGLSDLPAVRRLAIWTALTAGLSRQRAEELALAVNEIATNALLHGRAPASLRIWSAEEELILEVTDAGDGIADVFAGQLPPSAESIGGRGLWLTRLVCDAVEIRSDARCTVTMRARTKTNGGPVNRSG